MKYHAIFVIHEKTANLKLLSAANYRWRFKGEQQKKAYFDYCVFCIKCTLKSSNDMKGTNDVWYKCI